MIDPDKNLGTEAFYVSMIRIEALLEQLLFKTIIESSESNEVAEASFKIALENVNSHVRAVVSSLPNAK